MNAPIDTGGQAIACLTVRDCFIAAAPAEPWPEFKPAMPPKPSSPPLEPVGNDGEAPTDDELRSLLDWHNDPIWDAHIVHPKFSFWVDAWLEYWHTMRARNDQGNGRADSRPSR